MRDRPALELVSPAVSPPEVVCRMERGRGGSYEEEREGGGGRGREEKMPAAAHKNGLAWESAPFLSMARRTDGVDSCISNASPGGAKLQEWVMGT